jgi:hypothetical protein
MFKQYRDYPIFCSKSGIILTQFRKWKNNLYGGVVANNSNGFSYNGKSFYRKQIIKECWPEQCSINNNIQRIVICDSRMQKQYFDGFEDVRKVFPKLKDEFINLLCTERKSHEGYVFRYID